jgi:hypothetical protein
MANEQRAFGLDPQPRRAQSFLVRVWLEPREGAGQAPRLVSMVRDLATGEERYLSEPERVVDFLRRQLVGQAEEEAAAEGMTAS